MRAAFLVKRNMWMAPYCRPTYEVCFGIEVFR